MNASGALRAGPPLAHGCANRKIPLITPVASAAAPGDPVQQPGRRKKITHSRRSPARVAERIASNKMAEASMARPAGRKSTAGGSTEAVTTAGRISVGPSALLGRKITRGPCEVGRFRPAHGRRKKIAFAGSPGPEQRRRVALGVKGPRQPVPSYPVTRAGSSTKSGEDRRGEKSAAQSSPTAGPVLLACARNEIFSAQRAEVIVHVRREGSPPGRRK